MFRDSRIRMKWKEEKSHADYAQERHFDALAKGHRITSAEEYYQWNGSGIESHRWKSTSRHKIQKKHAIERVERTQRK